jgi:hypothetical protein
MLLMDEGSLKEGYRNELKAGSHSEFRRVVDEAIAACR